MPKSNREYWTKKIESNQERDRKARTALAHLGWKVAVFWECELKNESFAVARIRKFLAA